MWISQLLNALIILLHVEISFSFNFMHFLRHVCCSILPFERRAACSRGAELGWNTVPHCGK